MEHQSLLNRVNKISSAIEQLIGTVLDDNRSDTTKVLCILNRRIVGIQFPVHFGTTTTIVKKLGEEPLSIVINSEFSYDSLKTHLFYKPGIESQAFVKNNLSIAFEYIKSRLPGKQIRRVYIDHSQSFTSYNKLAKMLAEFADPNVVIVKL